MKIGLNRVKIMAQFKKQRSLKEISDTSELKKLDYARKNLH